MRRPAVMVAIAALFILSLVPLTEVSAAGAKSNAPTFGTGPSEGEVVSGTVTIVVSTTSGLDAASLDLNDGNSWVPLTNITSSSSWIYNWDSSTVSDGNYQLRLEGWNSGGSTGSTNGANFTVDNTNPSNLAFVVENPDYGTGISLANRAWYSLPSDGTLSFTWNASDANLDHATLTNVPGPGSPSNDGPGFLAYRWDWTTGGFPSQGTWDSQLTVYDSGGSSTSATRYIGIDTVGPTVGTPSLSISSDWNNAYTLIFSNLFNGASDNGGSGINGYEVRDSTDSTWTTVGFGGSGSLSLQEGVRQIQFRAVDNVGNRGEAINYTLQIDHNAPVAGGWIVPELTTALSGGIDIEVQASDALSGINLTHTKIQYGFDSDGIGQTPDITSSWIDVGFGLSATLSTSIDWSTKEGQFLSLRAVMVDDAGNSDTSTTQHFVVFPSFDFSWDSATVDRLVVRAGSEGEVTITSILVSNEAYPGNVIVRLQTAPADRNSDVSWTTLETRTLPPIALYDMQEEMSWSVNILNEGEYDIRLTVDPDDAVSERDEANNDAYMVVQGASQNMVGAVPSFSPSLMIVALAGIWLGYWLTRKKGEEIHSSAQDTDSSSANSIISVTASSSSGSTCDDL
ncbi:MAG: CARDB domain-containing protein [Candidatus Thalassarchaeaceae archaeon]|nr:CARDB domain-containing protein [Candidatus Thalassarchaeaceae archaeon]